MFGRSEEQAHIFDSHVSQPEQNVSVEGANLAEIIQNPEILFTEPDLSPEDKYKKHRENRNFLTDKANFIGMGNDGFVVAMGDKENDLVCIKYVWETLEVYPGEDVDVSFFDDEIMTLHSIAEQFERIRAATRSFALESGQTMIGKNSPLREAAFQESARRILMEAGSRCYVPEIIEVDSFHETEDEGPDDPNPLYFLDEKYSTIRMENVKGKSIQDIILGYPETKEYIEAIDIDAVERDLDEAFDILHDHGIKHQDVTVRNIMFDFEKKRPVIIDFGKSAYGSGDISIEDEKKHLKEVIGHLRSFLNSPEDKRRTMLASWEKQSRKLGI